MDLFADIGENSLVDSIAVLLLMALWGGAIVLIDHWVRSDRAGHTTLILFRVFTRVTAIRDKTPARFPETSGQFRLPL